MFVQENNLFQSKMGLLEINGIDSKKVLATLDEPCSGTPRKRRRLDDLTSEERVLRRKLKNRVAAQTARDRKKARMTELEDIVVQIEKENNLLKTSNEELRARLQMVSEENLKLKDRLGMAPHSTSSDHEYAAPCPTKSTSEQTKQIQYDTNSNNSDSNHVVIKTEEASPEYASFRMISQQQKFQILLLSLITIWLHSLSLKTSVSFTTKSAKKLRWLRSLTQLISKLKNVTAILRMLCHPSQKALQIPQTQELMGTPLKTCDSLETLEAWWATRPLMKYLSARMR